MKGQLIKAAALTFKLNPSTRSKVEWLKNAFDLHLHFQHFCHILFSFGGVCDMSVGGCIPYIAVGGDRGVYAETQIKLQASSLPGHWFFFLLAEVCGLQICKSPVISRDWAQSKEPVNILLSGLRRRSESIFKTTFLNNPLPSSIKQASRKHSYFLVPVCPLLASHFFTLETKDIACSPIFLLTPPPDPSFQSMDFLCACNDNSPSSLFLGSHAPCHYF